MIRSYLNAPIGVHPADAAEQAVDLLADGLDEPEHDAVHDRLVGRRRRSLNLAVNRYHVVNDLLDVVPGVGRPWASGPVELARVHRRLNDGHDGLAFQFHVGFKQLERFS